MRGPIGPRAFQLEPDLAVAGQFEAVVCHGGAEGVPAHTLQPVPLIRGHTKPGMEIKAVMARVTLSEPS